MASIAPTDNLSSSVTKLSLKTTSIETVTAKPSQTKKSKKGPAVADSWEDEASDEEEDTTTAAAPAPITFTVEYEDEGETPIATRLGGGTSAPPPTPMSPVGNRRPFSPTALNAPGTFSLPTTFEAIDESSPTTPLSAVSAGSAKRPEKTDAVARRMIASALGVKAPKATEEQRAYDRAVREKERKRREEEKDKERKREEEAAKARQAVWED